MKCPECQFDNREAARFCGKCRAKLGCVCPACNSENSPENNFCDERDHDLAKPIESPQIDFTQPQSYTPRHLADKILNNRSPLEYKSKQ